MDTTALHIGIENSSVIAEATKEGLHYHIGAHVVLAMLGIFIRLLVRFKVKRDNLREDKGEVLKFSFKHFIVDNLVEGLIAGFSTIALLMMIDGLSIYIGVSPDIQKAVYPLIAFMIGYFNYTMLKFIIKRFEKKHLKPEDNGQA